MLAAMAHAIEIGYQVYAQEGGEEFGAIRAVKRNGRPEIVVYVENAGDFVIPQSAVKAVHDAKVIIDLTAVGPSLREAVAHAHDRESE
jgi:hypothetical protein